MNVLIALITFVIPVIPKYESAPHKDKVALIQQLKENPELPPIGFWMAVAQCETALEWDRGAHWRGTQVSGGLGIAHSTWGGYGGKQFASRAGKASMYAQIIVANRVGFLGWQTDGYRTWKDRIAGKKFFRPAAGFDQGWGGTCRLHWLKKYGRP